MAQQQLFPQEIIENTTETYLSKIAIKSQIIYTTVLLFILGVFLALPFILVDVSIKSAGVLRTVLEKNEIKSLLAGTIIQIHTKDNQSVKKDSVLFLLNTEILDTKLRLNQTQQQEKQQFIQDLNLLLAQKGFEKLITLSSAFYTQQFNQLYFTLSEKQSQLKKEKQDLDRTKLLYNQKVVATAEMEEKQFLFDKLQAEYQTLIATQRSQWASDLNNLRITLTELQSEAKQIAQEKVLYQIKAPANGTFQFATGKYIGSYVQAGEVLGVISPDSNLIAECYLSPKDIGLLRKGMKAKFQIDAFNYNEWGFIKGEIIEIANDYVLLENKPVFKVKCRLESKNIQLKNGFVGMLKKGMTIQARFVITQRSLFQLLYDNMDDWLNPSSSQLNK